MSLGIVLSIFRQSFNALVAQLVEVAVLEAVECQFESDRGYQSYNADVMELVYVSDLKFEFCGFESHLPYQK